MLVVSKQYVIPLRLYNKLLGVINDLYVQVSLHPYYNPAGVRYHHVPSSIELFMHDFDQFYSSIYNLMIEGMVEQTNQDELDVREYISLNWDDVQEKVMDQITETCRVNDLCIYDDANKQVINKYTVKVW